MSDNGSSLCTESNHLLELLENTKWEQYDLENKCCCTALQVQLVNALHQVRCSRENLASLHGFPFKADEPFNKLFNCLYLKNLDEFKQLLDETEISLEELSTKTNRNLTLLQYTCVNNLQPAAEALLEKGISPSYPGNNGTPPLIAAVDSGSEHLVKYLLQFEPNSIDSVNAEGNTALHVAARKLNLSMVKLLLKYQPKQNIRNQQGLTPFSGNVLRGLLNKCVTVLQPDTTQLDEPNVRIDFDLLLDLSHKEPLELEVLLNLSEDKNTRELLTHPVAKALLAFKWQNIRYWHYTYLIIHIVFVIILNTCLNSDNSTLQIASTALLAPLWLAGVVKEALQAGTSPRLYFRSWQNVLDILLLASSLIAVICSYLGLESWIFQELYLLAIFTSFGKLVELTGRVPRYALQIEMFKRVSQSCLHVLAWYFPVIVAFALAFRSFFDTEMCHPDKETRPDFCTLANSVYRTFVMMTGEFDGSTIDEAPWVIRPLFLLFVFCVVIVMFNVLIGLAVNDTKKLRNRADLYSTNARVKAVWSIEKIKMGSIRKIESLRKSESGNGAILTTFKKKGNNLHLEKEKEREAYLDSRGVQAVLEIISVRTRGSDLNKVQNDLATIRHNLDNLMQNFKNQEH